MEGAMTKYYIDKTKEKQPVIVWINKEGQFKGVYREVLDAQHDMEESGEGGVIISTTIIKPRDRKTYPFL
jgi:hypothetical protein